MKIMHLMNYDVVYQRDGNDRNGNPAYLVNIFPYDGIAAECNDSFKFGRHTKKGIKVQSYNIESDLEHWIENA